jgi:hypothetical protein
MSQTATQPHGEDWLGLNRLAAVFAEHHTPPQPDAGSPGDREVVDRFNRTLEILALVEENASPLRQHARLASEHDALRLASDLRRLANRLQSVGDFLAQASDGVLELEDQLLLELDERFRQQSNCDPAPARQGSLPRFPLAAVGA